MSRAKSVCIQPVIPAKVYEQLEAESKASGLSQSHIIAYLLHTHLPKLPK